MSPEILLTLEQVAERLAVSRKMVFDWVRAGKIPGVKMGRLWRVKESALDAFIDSLETVLPHEDERCVERDDEKE
jgi:excisionase family DNA binding protein